MMRLETVNQRRWTRYTLPASVAPRQDLFSGLSGNEGSGSPRNQTGAPHAGGGSSPLPGSSSPLPGDSSPLDAKGEESAPKGEEWKAAAATVAAKGKVSREEMEATVLELCRGRHLTLTELAQLLNRAPASLRNKDPYSDDQGGAAPLSLP